MSAWEAVFAEVRRFEDALALMTLVEGRDVELCADGEPLGAFLHAPAASERPLAQELARRLGEAGGDASAWAWTDFYPATRPSECDVGEVADLVERIGRAGVTLTYSDGSPVRAPRRRR